MQRRRDVIDGFIVFEGVDGSGTSTQLKLLGERMSAYGVAPRLDAEPTAGPIGRLIRDALFKRAPLAHETVARLFAADRGEHIDGAGGVREAVAAGRLVVSDRYFFSSLAYQGLTCGPELPEELNARFPLPELLVFFDIPAAVSVARLSARAERDIYEHEAFQIRVEAAYREIVARFDGGPMRIARVDASAPIEKVAEQVWAAVEPVAARYRR
jgi:dTMP kinase